MRFTYHVPTISHMNGLLAFVVSMAKLSPVRFFAPMPYMHTHTANNGAGSGPLTQVTPSSLFCVFLYIIYYIFV